MKNVSKKALILCLMSINIFNNTIAASDRFVREDKNKALRANVYKGNITEIKRLIKEGANVNARGKINRLTALDIAVKKDDINIVKILLNAKANVNAQPKGDDNIKEGRTPLHWASYHGHTQIAKLLLDKGANINMKEWAAGHFAEAPKATPLHLAHTVSMIKLLIQYKVNPFLKNAFGDTQLDMLKNEKKTIRDKKMQSVIQNAINILETYMATFKKKKSRK